MQNMFSGMLVVLFTDYLHKL